jgi:O-succinylbenzoic acid--CoA ligase
MALDAPLGQSHVDAFMPKLAAALEGDGPALLPLPSSPKSVRDQLLAASLPSENLPADTALLVPTSGSSGSPKLAMLSSKALRASASATHDALGGGGRWLLALPTTHIAGLQVLVRSHLAGYPPVVLDTTEGFRIESLVDSAKVLLDDIGTQPRYTALVPTQLQRVLDGGRAGIAALMAMDAVLLGGAAATTDLIHQAHDAGITLVQTYGLTETCGGCVYDGVPLDGVTVSLDAHGRVSIEGPILFSGYRGDEVLTREVLFGGTLRTNDIGEFDDHGRLHIIGRADDVVVSGGFSVSCNRVELLISKHPKVREVVVVGLPDADWGERVVAVAVTEPDLTLDALRSDFSGVLESHELPRQLLRVDAIPFLPSGKPDRQVIKRLL